MAPIDQERQKANKKLVIKLVWGVFGALLFAFALVPLYNVICNVTGLNGKTNSLPDKVSQQVDLSREVVVELTSTVMPGLGWDFYPETSSVKLHPGQIQSVNFIAKNVTNEIVTGQAIPSISPGEATSYFKKIECFCFQRQSLNPGEVKKMPLRFYVSPDLPKDIHVITLSYAFYNAVKVDKKP
ncbi:MAG: cytochrome c oxidase assembly protein [Candidatus Methylopumilus sp.]|jgi:cytochrome c oxidase assembly protein subunit 11